MYRMQIVNDSHIVFVLFFIYLDQTILNEVFVALVDFWRPKYHPAFARYCRLATYNLQSAHGVRR